MKLKNEIRKYRESKKIQRKITRYVDRKISKMPSIYQEAPTYAIHSVEVFNVIQGLESKIKNN